MLDHSIVESGLVEYVVGWQVGIIVERTRPLYLVSSPIPQN